LGKRCPYFIPFCSVLDLRHSQGFCIFASLYVSATKASSHNQRLSVKLTLNQCRISVKFVYTKEQKRGSYGKSRTRRTLSKVHRQDRKTLLPLDGWQTDGYENPDMSKVKWSGVQKANRERFREAIAYARAAMADPKVRAYYQKVAKKANRQPFRVAVSDFCAGKNLLEKK
jgi:hypothetical protein